MSWIFLRLFFHLRWLIDLGFSFLGWYPIKNIIKFLVKVPVIFCLWIFFFFALFLLYHCLLALWLRFSPLTLLRLMILAFYRCLEWILVEIKLLFFDLTFHCFFRLIRLFTLLISETLLWYVIDPSALNCIRLWLFKLSFPLNGLRFIEDISSSLNFTDWIEFLFRWFLLNWRFPFIGTKGHSIRNS